MLAEWKCKMAFFAETWLQSTSTIDQHLEIPNFNTHRRDRPNRSHGGLLVYTHTTLNSLRRPDLEEKNIECITIQVPFSSSVNGIFFFCYRPPDQSHETFFGTLSSLLSSVEHDTNLIFLLGDVNAKHTAWDRETITNSAGTFLYNMALDFSLTQCITEPTRFSSDGTSKSTLDLLLTNRPDLVLESQVTSPISDHCCVTSLIEGFPSRQASTNTRITLPDFNQADWSALRSALHRAPLFQAIQGTNNVSVAWEVWQQIFPSIISQHIPTRTITLRTRNKVWMTSKLHHLSRKKHRIFQAAKRNPSTTAWGKFKKVRNECNAAFQKAKREHNNKLCEELNEQKPGSHNWWSKVKSMANMSSPKATTIPDLTSGSMTATTDAEKAELLASHFSRIQSSDSHSLPHLSPDECPGAPYPLPSGHPEFSFPAFREEDVLCHLQRLPPHKATDNPWVSNCVLHETALFIAPSLTYIFNLSLNTLTFPDSWKSAVICPLFKNRGSRQDPGNYRPVSLLSAVGKTMDALLSQSLCRYLVNEQLISNHQFGFLPGRSTTTQLVYLTDQLIKALDKRCSTVTVFMDFMRPFDKVWHRGLLHKLAQAGLEQSALAWIKDYLSDRNIAVRVGSSLSAKHSVSTGVPQGSHLGPILFLAFINDLPATTGPGTDIYADDTIIRQLLIPSHVEESLQSLQTSISAAEKWASSWNGRFGHAKTAILAVGQLAKDSMELTPPKIEEKPFLW